MCVCVCVCVCVCADIPLNKETNQPYIKSFSLILSLYLLFVFPSFSILLVWFNLIYLFNGMSTQNFTFNTFEVSSL